MKIHLFIPGRILRLVRPPAVDRIVIEYGVTHWNVVAVQDRTGRRAILAQPAVVEWAVDLAQRLARSSGVAVGFGPGAAGWTHLLTASA